MPNLLRLSPIIAVLTLICVVFAAPSERAWAQREPGVQLTNDIIDRLLTSYADMRALGKKYDKVGRGRGGDPVGSMAMALSGRADAVNIATRNGFADFAEWANALTTLALTLSVVDSGKDLAQISAEQQGALAQIDAMPMDAAQKEAMRKAILSSFGVMGRVTPENYALVKNRHKEISQAMKTPDK